MIFSSKWQWPFYRCLMLPVFLSFDPTQNQTKIENKILQIEFHLTPISITLKKNESHLLFNCPPMKKQRWKILLFLHPPSAIITFLFFWATRKCIFVLLLLVEGQPPSYSGTTILWRCWFWAVQGLPFNQYPTVRPQFSAAPLFFKGKNGSFLLPHLSGFNVTILCMSKILIYYALYQSQMCFSSLTYVLPLVLYWLPFEPEFPVQFPETVL